MLHAVIAPAVLPVQLAADGMMDLQYPAFAVTKPFRRVTADSIDAGCSATEGLPQRAAPWWFDKDIRDFHRFLHVTTREIGARSVAPRIAPSTKFPTKTRSTASNTGRPVGNWPKQSDSMMHGSQRCQTASAAPADNNLCQACDDLHSLNLPVLGP